MHTRTSTTWVGFEPTIPALERAKSVNALDRATTVMVIKYKMQNYNMDAKIIFSEI
jgi:hypothetical protein